MLFNSMYLSYDDMIYKELWQKFKPFVVQAGTSCIC